MDVGPPGEKLRVRTFHKEFHTIVFCPLAGFCEANGQKTLRADCC
jgi:hypothetical protein